jgi:hypothetical protein
MSEVPRGHRQVGGGSSRTAGTVFFGLTKLTPGPGGREATRPTLSGDLRGFCPYDFQAVISAEAT